MFHAATKVTIIAERLLQKKLTERIEAAGAKGYTIVEGSGKGEHFLRSGDRATVVQAFSIIRIEAVFAEEESAKRLAETVARAYFSEYSGIVYLSPIEVIRKDKF
jgi:nitrogen regulatory protein PII